MSPRPPTSCSAFDQQRLIASGPLPDVVRAAKQALDAGAGDPLLILDNASSRPIEVDFRGSLDDVLARLPSEPAVPAATPGRGPGRPKLGVVAREVTLLPRHWDWLARQPGGASASLRKLVEQSLRGNGKQDRARLAMESVDRFMLAMTGNLPGYEEASRAFYRGEHERFAELIATWPADLRDHLQRLASTAWELRES
ncbi:MAG TPA: DUF2239 family protein [Rhodanobacter sp.]|nr:DUF2239 family protein [Rhodanobacter sp.]